MSFLMRHCTEGGRSARSADFDGKVGATIYLRFDSYIAEEKTHQESVNDGWFTTTHTVSDGWQWTDALPARISATLTIKDDAIKATELYQSLCRKLADGRTKISDDTYSKNVTIGGKTLECRTSLKESYNNVNLEITFNQ